MKTNKQTVVTLVVIAALLIFIGWAFYQDLDSPANQESIVTKTPQKAVMAQAQALNDARLEELAQRGQVATGMSMAQVRLALSEPVRSITDSVRTTWWYEHEGGRIIHFGADGKVDKIEQQED
ncbi:hypothetical protein KJ068_07230 [bacterium]|nr:hypothetical protein [bacterium]